MITDVQSVSVTYHGRKVGTLSMGNQQVCQFEYDKDWIADRFSLSPLKLPLKTGIITADYYPFNGNFGVFEDSLPGGYGEYLLRKVLSKSGINYGALTPVQRLSLVGSSGMGALCYEPETTASGLLNEPITPPKMDYHSLLQLTGYLTQSPVEVEQQFRRMAFNVFARNHDDHARNFRVLTSASPVPAVWKSSRKSEKERKN